MNLIQTIVFVLLIAAALGIFLATLETIKQYFKRKLNSE